MCEVDRLLDEVWSGVLPTEETVSRICTMAKDVLVEEPNVLQLSTPITVCGDIHGQYADLKKLFSVGGRVPHTRYLFLGDFVDRGMQSVETFLLFVLLKIKYTDRIYLLRGNHETRQITAIYGFYDECMRKYGTANVWRCCTDLFDYLSLSALIDGEIFCIHGGLSPAIKEIDSIGYIDRKRETPQAGPVSDLLWSDPETTLEEWDTSQRGAGYIFGRAVVEKFLHENNLAQICRAHQLVMEGYKKMFDGKVITVWSAPNYCGRCGNLASVLVLRKNTNNIFLLFSEAGAEKESCFLHQYAE
ncbi:MAG: serine/threonine-protein phosphatase [Amphiamblys sp. WSBS2006]|nr:MAG: serine/threonine-protein phosphatase [Amphiamblys sp. WSBS2006]